MTWATAINRPDFEFIPRQLYVPHWAPGESVFVKPKICCQAF